MILDTFVLEYSQQPTSNQSHLNYSINELYQYILENKGKVGDSFWLMYFDALRFLGDSESRQKFEKASQSYMKVKNTLPPKWEDDFEYKPYSLTTNIMRVSELDKVNFAKVEDFIATTKAGSKISRVDFSITEFDLNKDYSQSIEWFTHLFLNVQGHTCSILGVSNLLNFLREKIKTTPNKLYGELLLTILQCLGDKKGYDELTDWYINEFEETAREYREENILKAPETEEDKFEEFALNKNVELSDVIMFSQYLKNKINDGTEIIEVDCSACQHIESMALQDLVKVFIENKDMIENRTIVFKDLHQIVKFMLEAMGLDKNLVSLKLIKYC